MATPVSVPFFDYDALLDRLSVGLKKQQQKAVFLVGAPLTAPAGESPSEVPSVDGIIEMIRDEFRDDPSQLLALDEHLRSADRPYQLAFQFLQGRRGQQTANRIIRSAVIRARVDPSGLGGLDAVLASDENCQMLEDDTAGWHINSATAAIGGLVTQFPNVFGSTLLTTNFDPLLEVSIRKNGGRYYKTVLHSDGNLAQTTGDGCHIVHLHGYWWGSDTLHTARQLTQDRPRLKASLASHLRNKLLVVCAYGAWDDVVTETLLQVVIDDQSYPDLIWTLHDSTPTLPSGLLAKLQPGWIAEG